MARLCKNYSPPPIISPLHSSPLCLFFVTLSSIVVLYVLEGGINRWIETFAQDDERLRVLSEGDEEELRCEFAAALGSAFPASDPDAHAYEIEYESKIKLELKRGPLGGGCG